VTDVPPEPIPASCSLELEHHSRFCPTCSSRLEDSRCKLVRRFLLDPLPLGYLEAKFLRFSDLRMVGVCKILPIKELHTKYLFSIS
jgi:hypothetical protein